MKKTSQSVKLDLRLKNTAIKKHVGDNLGNFNESRV